MQFLLQHHLERAAVTTPDAMAVVDGDRSATYRELDERSDQLAGLLVELGIRRGDRVGLYLDKSLESVIAIYGVLKAGACYVPFDPSAPAARLAFIAADCGLTCLVTGTEKAGRWADVVAGSSVMSLVVLNTASVLVDDVPTGMRGVGAGALDGRSKPAASQGAISLDLAYILYTSGSTGAPKGVMLSHRNALAFVDWAADEFALTADDRLSSHAPLHFDLSVFDVFAAAAAGAALVLVPSRVSLFPIEVARFIEEQAITVWYSVPSVLSMLTERGGLEPAALPSLRTVLFAGEVFPTKYLRGLMRLVPHARFCNLYGPTETNVCTWFDVPPLPDDQAAPIPIGHAIDDVEVFAVTDEGRRAERGEVGELFVRGNTVMQGYWGDAERTAQSLVPDPTGQAGDLVYHTGDLVRELDSGELEFLGRRDSQIKSRGYRIELGEIETAIYANPSVVECAVVAVPDELVTNRLRAFVVARDEVGAAELARACGERVPRYMVPERFDLRESLPKTSTGKVDRQALASEAVSAQD